MDKSECQFDCKSLYSASSHSIFSNSSADQRLPCFSNCLAHSITGIPANNDAIISVATLGRNIVYAGTEKGNIQILNNDNCRVVHVKTVRCENSSVKSFVVAGNKVYSAHKDKKIRVRHTPRRLLLCLKLSTLISAITDHLKNLFRSVSFVERRHHKSPCFRHFDAISCLAIGLDGDFLYSGSWDKTVKVWRLRDFVCVESINAHDDSVNAIAVGGHGMLFTASADGTVKAWKQATVSEKGRCHHKLVVELKQGKDVAASPVNAIALSSDESVLYSGTSTSDINFWTSDEKSQEIISYKGTLKGHERSVLCLTSVGKLLCSGSADKSIRIWKRETVSKNETYHVCLAILEGHSSPVKCMAVAAPASTTYSSSLSPNSSNFSLFSSYEDSNHSSTTSADDYHEDEEGIDSDSQVFTLYSGSLDGSLRVWWINTEGVLSESFRSC